MTTLFDMTYRLAGFLMYMRRAAATGGGYTSLVDSLATFSSDQVGGTLFLFTGDLANKTLVVTSLTGTTQVNFATQTPNDVAAGNRYALACNDFDRETLRWAINEAVREYSKRRAEDETLVSVTDQEVYTLPAGVSDVKELWVAEETAEPYGWKQYFHWDEVDGDIRMPKGWTLALDDYKMRVVYRDAFAELDADADELPQDVDPELVFWAAAVHAVRDGNMRFHDDPKRDLVNKMNEAQAKLMEKRRNWREWQRSVRPKD